MLTCKEASFLVSKKLDGNLNRRERIRLWLHLAMCSLCRHYARDVKKLHEMMKKAGEAGQTLLPGAVKLSRQSRERIKNTLNKVLQQSE